MKQLYFLAIVFFFFSEIHAQNINIPDAYFKAALVSSYDLDEDFEINTWEAANVQGISMPNAGITDFEGIQYFTNLQNLDCSGNHNVANFNLIYTLPITTLICNDMGLTSLDLSTFPNLTWLNCNKNLLTALDASGLSALDVLHCAENELTSISVAGDSQLEYYYCNNNTLTTIDFTGLNKLKQVACYANHLTDLSSINSVNSTFLEVMACNDNQFSGMISLPNAPNLKSLNCSGNMLTGINLAAGSNLILLYCSNNQLSTLDLVPYTTLKLLQCNNNQLTTLQVFSPVIETLEFKSNSITSVTLTGGTAALKNVLASYNQLSELDLTGAVVLRKLYIDHNNFTHYNSAMPIWGWTELAYFDCSYNNLTSIDISQYSPNYVYFNHNQLTEIIQSPSQHVEIFEAKENAFTEFILKCSIGTLHLSDNPSLNFINLKDGNSGTAAGVYFSNCPNLRYICVKDAYNQQATIQYKITSYGYTDCHVNSYCSFNPGGTYNVIAGNQRFDHDNNGCDSNDVPIKGIRLNVTGGVASGTTISADAGIYSIPVADGTYTVTPTVENPEYFSVSPTSFTAVFPSQASPLTQDICISPIGVHHDLEVVIVPVSRARPGFDAVYKITYKNNGNQIESGLLSMGFDDAVLDYVVSNPTISSQSTNSLQWNFNNLLPFESREIFFTLNVNSPMESPAIVNGSILNFTASVNSDATDETPDDNHCVFQQTVTNSIDPNDKICLEGTAVTPEMVGKDVHYIIHFENTGTDVAENIVVKDIIDTDKFDINSLVPMDASHPFSTRIVDNKVEFIFQNINLPFDDANNDGYVAFKIKTKPTLVVGNTFSNTASIYFDYNFPIATNTATTTVAALAVQDFAFENYIAIHPNPAHDVLNIEMKQEITITSFSIYNTLGQLTLIIPNAQQTKTIDVSGLKTGNYFLKINSDKGISNTKFVKL